MGRWRNEISLSPNTKIDFRKLLATVQRGREGERREGRSEVVRERGEREGVK